MKPLIQIFASKGFVKACQVGWIRTTHDFTFIIRHLVSGQKTKDEGTARLRFSMPNDRDVSELKLEAGVMQSRVERPDQIPTVRRQSFFV